MALGPGPPPGPPRRMPQPSDPELAATATKWQGFITENLPFPLVNATRVGPEAWQVVEPKAVAAMRAGGFALSWERTPLYRPDPWRITMMEPGQGWIVGDSELVRLSHNAWLTQPAYSSLVVGLRLKADPLPTRHDLGTPETPTIWNITIMVGAMESYDAFNRHSGRYRSISKMLPLDPAFGWIPSAIAGAL